MGYSCIGKIVVVGGFADGEFDATGARRAGVREGDGVVEFADSREFGWVVEREI
jgi:hypothetical protein